MTSIFRAILTPLVVTLVLGIAGCGNRLTMEKYEKIKTGMTLQEVEAILGAGKEVSPPKVELPGDFPPFTGKVYEWKSGKRTIQVTLDETGRVSGTSILTPDIP